MHFISFSILIVNILLVMTLGHSAQARVFNFKNEKLATYLRGTGGLSNVKKSGFESSSGTDLTFSDQTNYNYSAEFGLLFTVSSVNVRLGLELFRPNAITGVEAKNASSAVVYAMDSSIIGYGPVVNFEVVNSQTDRSRILIAFGGGYITTTLRNEYRFASGDPGGYGLQNFVEEGSAQNFMAQVAFGYEFLLSDAATAVFDFGYRSLLVTGLKHQRDAVTIEHGAVTAGTTMKNRNGTDRSLDLSGIWLGIGLRFYIGL